MKIVYFSPIEWDFVRQRPQHLLSRLTIHHEVTYVQPFGLRSVRFTDARRALNRLAQILGRRAKLGKVTSGIVLKSPVYLPFVNDWVSQVNLLLLRVQLSSLINRDTVVWVASPSRLIPELIKNCDYRALLYEMMDDFSKLQPLVKDTIIASESQLISMADAIIVTSQVLREKAGKAQRGSQGGDIHIISNGVEYDFFQIPSPCPAALQGMRKIIGYVGTLDRWIDFDLLAYIADSYSDYDVVLVGPVKVPQVPLRNNLHYLGQVEYSEIPAYCRCFDVCLIPFLRGELADSINPIKLYEYFAVGKPVVALDMKELQPYRELLFLAVDREEFCQQVQRALKEVDPSVVLRRKEVARANDWQSKIHELIAVLEKL